MKYHSIVVNCYYFSEGDFWNIGADGYQDPNSLDDPDSIETDPHCLESSKYTEEDVIDEMKMIADLYLNGHDPITNSVTLIMNGNEVETIKNEHQRT